MTKVTSQSYRGLFLCCIFMVSHCVQYIIIISFLHYILSPSSRICCFPSPQLTSSLTPPGVFPILCVQVIQMFTVALRFWQQTPYYIQKTEFYSIPSCLLAHIVFLPFLKWVKQIFLLGLCSPYCQYFEELWVPTWTMTHC